jgi:hypothetical protein
MAPVTPRRGWAVILLSVLALTAVWRFLPEGSPPIYDGQCIADPYVTLSSSPPAKGATQTFPKASGFPSAEVNTNESPPQAILLTLAGTFVNSTPVTVSITPIPAPAVKPPNGHIQGNVYRFSAVNASGAEVEPVSKALAVYVILRALQSVPAPTIDRFNGTSWVPLDTMNEGCGNSFEVVTSQLGEYATVVSGGNGTAPASSAAGIPGLAIIGALAVLLIIAVVVLFTLDRRRGAPR